MKRFLSRYLPGYAATLVYMLQSTEYNVKAYLSWYRRVENFRTVMYRRTLHKTKAANLLLLALRCGMVVQVVLGLSCSWYGNQQFSLLWSIVGLALILTYPFTWAYIVTFPLLFGRWMIVNPRNKKLIAESEQIFDRSTAVKIAIAGSYGKTSMKELLTTILSEGKKVAATPANKNVPVSHAYFAKKLTGDEEVLVIEYGEGAPGDVTRFAKVTHPDIAIITGLAPAHLNQYPTLEAAGEDIFSVSSYVKNDNVYVNGDSDAAKKFIRSGYHVYDHTGVLGWKVANVHVGFDGTKFTLINGKETLKLHSQLLGRHHIGPLVLAVALAHQLGLSKEQIQEGVGQTKPFEHRMQPRPLHGAWIIDDTYNGNIDGMKAGLELLKELPGKQKIYVTPGLVDQGVENERVHKDLGRAIAAASPNKVILMQNSATEYIEQGLQEGRFDGEVIIEEDPLAFYTNLEHFIAAGDVVLMQNDWTDNYN